MNYSDIKKFRRPDGYIVLDEIYKRVPKQEELKGKNKKEWLLFSDKRALIKEVPEGSYADYMELLIAELMKQAGLEAAEYELIALNGKKGVITPDFVKERETLISGKDFLKSALDIEDIDERDVSCNNIEDIEKALILWNVPTAQKENMIKKLATQFAVDCITLQPDRHWRNWGLIVKNGAINKISAHYDAGYAMRCESKEKRISSYLKRAKEIKKPSAKRRFFEEEIIPQNWKSITLRYSKSDTPYGMKLFREAMEKNPQLMGKIAGVVQRLDPEKAIRDVERNIGTTINPICAEWFRTVTEFNIREVGEIVNAKDNSFNVERD